MMNEEAASSSSSSSIPEDQLGFTSASQIYSVRHFCNVLSSGSVSKDKFVPKAFETGKMFLSMIKCSNRCNKITITCTPMKND